MSEIFRLKLIFVVLYFVQGATISYFSIFQKPYLNSLDIDRGVIGALYGILLLPFILKIGFGWFSDRYPIAKLGHRKPYMLCGLTLAMGCFVAASIVPAHVAFGPYALLMVMASFSIAMFDAATDGVAVDRIPEDEQSSVQAYMVTGKAIGVILVSQVIGYLVGVGGYSLVLLALGGLFVLPLLVTLGLRVEERSSSSLGEGTVRTRAFVLLGAMGVTYSIVSFGSDGLISLYLSDVFQVSAEQIGTYGSFRGVGAIVGALICGWLMRGRWFYHLAYLGLIQVALGALMVGWWLNAENFTYLGPLWGLIWGFNEVCYLTLAIHLVGQTQSAFGFAFLMALCNLGTALGEAIGTTMTKYLEFPIVFSLLAVFMVVPLALTYMTFSTPQFKPHKARG